MSTNTTLLRPSLKWPGGKFRELHEILPFIPADMNNFVDPFVGAGAVPLNINVKNVRGRYCLNDIDADLMAFYRLRGEALSTFYELVESVHHARKFAASSNVTVLDFETNFYSACIRCMRRLDPSLRLVDSLKIIESEQARRSRKIQALLQAGRKPDQNFAQTGVFAVIYYIVRRMFNLHKGEKWANEITPTRTAMWFILRELSFGAMMRYNSKGDFDVPYGGQSYNKKDILKKLTLVKAMHAKMDGRSLLGDIDFQVFLSDNATSRDDFVFLDPPYDTAFSSYSTRERFNGHEVLFNWMKTTPARFMMVTKKTDRISALYDELRLSAPHVVCDEFEKRYTVNIRNRFARDAVHLRITNY